MNNALRTESINRTVAVVIKHALDIDHAVDVLMAEFGFDRVFSALSTIDDDTKAHRAMWVALCTEVFDDHSFDDHVTGDQTFGAFGDQAFGDPNA